MDVELLKLLTDTGLFILIWMVQLVVYPSFVYMDERTIKKWHIPYTNRIVLIVLPLMLGQLALYSRALIEVINPHTVAPFLMVLATWGITFLWAIPLHGAIDGEKNSLSARKKLVQMNWIRTFFWTLIFIYSLIKYGA